MRFFPLAALTVLPCAACGSPTGGAGGASASATTSEATAGATTGVGGAATTSGDATTTSGAGGSSASSGGAGGGPTGFEACTTDAQCPGSHCVAILPGGYRVCAEILAAVTACNQPGLDECGACGAACPGGEPCYAGPLVPTCTGARAAPHHQCAEDQCQSDAQCDAGGVCLVAGVLGRKERSCLPAPCKHDGECGAAPGGACAPLVDPCCGDATTLYCVYPGDCRKNADCGAGFCEIDPVLQRTFCTMTPPLCPA